MAKKPIQTKLSTDGKKVTLMLSPERLKNILAKLKPCEERDQLAESMGLAKERATHIAREARLQTPLSIESLAPLGWMLTGEHSPIAYGAIREGDFRFDERDGRSGWVYGPHGAFDREPEGTKVIRGAVQAAVMSEVHHVYLLMTPTLDRPAAIKHASGLEAEWRDQLSAKRRRPVGVPQGMPQKYWASRMNLSDFDHLPEDATVCNIYGIGVLPVRARLSDAVHSGRSAKVFIISGDAKLGMVTRSPLFSREILRTTSGLGWMMADRHHDEYFDGVHDHRRILSTPYDCVLGQVWGALHNDQTDYQNPEKHFLLRGSNNCAESDTRYAQAFPLKSPEDANAAALRFAVELGMTEEKMPKAPKPISLPNFQDDELKIAA